MIFGEASLQQLKPFISRGSRHPTLEVMTVKVLGYFKLHQRKLLGVS